MSRYFDNSQSFIKQHFSRIKHALDKNILKYVVISSAIDESFGRTYIRWNCEVVLKHDGVWTYGEKYLAYQIFGRDDSRREKLLGGDSSRINPVFDEYHNDIHRFLELMSAYYPQVNVYCFITDFEFIKDKIFFGSFSDFNVLKFVDSELKSTRVNAPTKEELLALEGDNYELHYTFEWLSGWIDKYKLLKIVNQQRKKSYDESYGEYQKRLAILNNMNEKEYEKYLEDLRKQYELQ